MADPDDDLAEFEAEYEAQQKLRLPLARSKTEWEHRYRRAIAKRGWSERFCWATWFWPRWVREYPIPYDSWCELFELVPEEAAEEEMSYWCE